MDLSAVLPTRSAQSKNHRAKDVIGQLQRLSTREPLKYELEYKNTGFQSVTKWFGGNGFSHFQGIQKFKDVLWISSSTGKNKPSYLLGFKLDIYFATDDGKPRTGKLTSEVKVHPTLGHAGGLQLVGDSAVVGLEQVRGGSGPSVIKVHSESAHAFRLLTPSCPSDPSILYPCDHPVHPPPLFSSWISVLLSRPSP